MFIPPWAAPSRQFSQPATTISDPPPVFVRSPSSQSPHERSNRSVMQEGPLQLWGLLPLRMVSPTQTRRLKTEIETNPENTYAEKEIVITTWRSTACTRASGAILLQAIGHQSRDFPSKSFTPL